MRRWVLLLLLLAASIHVGCGRDRSHPPMPGVPPVPFSGEEAMAECESFVRLGPKSAGTKESRQAAEYIRDRLKAFGLKPWVDEFEDPVPGGTGVFRNVTAVLPGGSGEILILAAHYDTRVGVSETFAGANDSGSGVGLLLALAQVLSGIYPGSAPELRFLFLDGEECRREYGPADGLHGSRHAVRQLQKAGEVRKVRAMILVDMVGDRDLTVTIPRNGTSALIRQVLNAAADEGVRASFGIHPGVILDDHQPFLDVGIPAVDVIDFQYGSSPGANDYWHTDEDTMEKLDAKSLGKVGRVLLRLIQGTWGASHNQVDE